MLTSTYFAFFNECHSLNGLPLNWQPLLKGKKSNEHPGTHSDNYGILIFKIWKYISKTIKRCKAQLKYAFFKIGILPQLEYKYFNGHETGTGKIQTLTFITKSPKNLNNQLKNYNLNNQLKNIVHSPYSLVSFKHYVKYPNLT